MQRERENVWFDVLFSSRFHYLSLSLNLLHTAKKTSDMYHRTQYHEPTMWLLACCQQEPEQKRSTPHRGDYLSVYTGRRGVKSLGLECPNQPCNFYICVVVASPPRQSKSPLEIPSITLSDGAGVGLACLGPRHLKTVPLTSTARRFMIASIKSQASRSTVILVVGNCTYNSRCGTSRCSIQLHGPSTSWFENGTGIPPTETTITACMDEQTRDIIRQGTNVVHVRGIACARVNPSQAGGKHRASRSHRTKSNTLAPWTHRHDM
ncbi:hypothetical protein BKA93DRAFT_325592 [Sparassis latifolia]